MNQQLQNQQLQNQQLINDVLDWVKSDLNGLKYKWVYLSLNNYANTEALYGSCKELPSMDYIFKTGSNCVGLINLIKLKLNKHIPKNGTELDGCLSLWHNYLTVQNNYAHYTSDIISDVSKLKVGSIIYRPPKVTNIGHIAIYIGDNKIIHSCPNNVLCVGDNLVDRGVGIDDLDKIENELNFDTNYFTYYVDPEKWLLI